MVKAGLAKFNTTAKLSANSLKSTASTVLSNTQRSVGVSYGIKAQRSDSSIFNVKVHNSNSISALRHELNRKTIINNNIPTPAPRDDGMSTMEKLMMWSMLGSTALEFGKGIVDTIKEMKGASNTPKAAKTEDTVTAANIKKALTDLQAQAKGIGTRVAEFGTSYSQISNQETIDGLNGKIEQYKNDPDTQKFLNNIDINKLKLSDLNLSNESSLEDIKSAGEKIDTDTKNVNEVSSNLTQTLGAIDTEIAKLDPEQDGEKIKKLQQFKVALNDILTKANEVKGKLPNEKTNLEKLQKEKAENMDAIYDEVKKGDEQVAKNNKAMEQLEAKIKKEKDPAKKQKLIEAYNKYAAENEALSGSLKNYGNVENSTGTKYALRNEAKTERMANEPAKSNEVVSRTKSSNLAEATTNMFNIGTKLSDAERANLNHGGAIQKQTPKGNFATIKNLNNTYIIEMTDGENTKQKQFNSLEALENFLKTQWQDVDSIIESL